MTSLRVDGVEFLKPGVAISRGAYFHQQDTEKLPDVLQPEPRRDYGSRRRRRDPLRVRPGRKWSGRWRTRPTPSMSFFVVFDPTVMAVKNAEDEWDEDPIARPGIRRTAKWATTTWYAGRARMKLTGGIERLGSVGAEVSGLGGVLGSA